MVDIVGLEVTILLTKRFALSFISGPDLVDTSLTQLSKVLLSSRGSHCDLDSTLLLSTAEYIFAISTHTEFVLGTRVNDVVFHDTRSDRRKSLRVGTSDLWRVSSLAASNVIDIKAASFSTLHNKVGVIHVLHFLFG